MKPIGYTSSVLCAFAGTLLVTPGFAGNEPAEGAVVETSETEADAEFDFSKGLKAAIADGDITVDFGGRVMWDVGFSSADDDLKTPAAGYDMFEFSDGTEFRRARFFAKGTIYDAVEYKAEYDFAGGDADFKDVYMQLDLGFADLRAGHYFEPFGLEQNTSSKYITFMERSLTGAFTPERNSGLMLHHVLECDMPATWAVGVFRDTNDYGDDKSSDSGEYNVTARATAAPMHDDSTGELLHFGLAASMRSDMGGTNRFRSRPENHLAPYIADTQDSNTSADFASDGYLLAGAEAAWGTGPFCAQAEYMMAEVDAPAGGTDLSFSGYYGMVSYFLTGEHRPYKDGTFGRVKPKKNMGQGGHGAWEVAARYSSLDLSDGTVLGGELNDITVGLNWYMNPNARMMLNYVNSELDKSVATANGEGSLDSFLVRFQFDF